jgi:hypothetical protein
MNLNLYSVHCGFYDDDISEGIYEFHVNIPVVAESEHAAKVNIKQHPLFQKKKMHVDGIQEIKKVSGYKIELVADGTDTQVTDHPLRDL